MYTMEYYSAIKKNEILSFVATRTHRETVILSEARQTQKDKYCIWHGLHTESKDKYCITAYIQHLKRKDANELIYKAETDSQTQRMNLQLPRGKGGMKGQFGRLGLTCSHVCHRSVMSDSLRPRGLQPMRLLRPWDFPGKSTGVG